MHENIAETNINKPSHDQINVIRFPAILIIGEEGSGKSTFGNWLLGSHGDDGPFEAGPLNNSVTKTCGSHLIKIVKIKDRTYNLIDTPGLFDPFEDVKSDKSLNKIADAINLCSYGIQTIVLVIKKDRTLNPKTIPMIKNFLGETALNHMIVALTYCNLKQTKNNEKLLEFLNPKLKLFLSLFDPFEDVKSDKSLNKIADAINLCSYGIQTIVLVIKKDRTLNPKTIPMIKNFLGETALNHMIVALTYCNLKQTKNNEKLLEFLNPKLKLFLSSIGNRYIISPNPDMFSKDDRIVINNMEKAKEFIDGFPRAYTTETFNKVRHAREDCEKILIPEQENEISKEEIKKLKEEINKIGKRIAKEEAAKKCFKLDTKVILEGGNLIPMSGVTVNDKICVDIINGKLKFSEVYLIAHCDYEDETEFLKVEYTSPSTGLTESVTLTPDHHILTDNYFDFAKSIKPHTTQLRVLDGTQMKSVRVTNVTTETHRGYIAIFTCTGTIVADNVMCSCYATVPPSYQSTINLFLMPLILYTKLKKSEYDGKSIHPYLDFLYGQYRMLEKSFF
ncbi:hypothetical protein Glove_41g109 [Diversispora epigaea]|uniref:Hint domain-containing protein n=1 Tax=Diversispora epigaea TaxID=1348612 RepID=A0A397JI97_9GLOM|nr:hypothetical protein Glove_41g109 [Diversispora epigaea]